MPAKRPGAGTLTLCCNKSDGTGVFPVSRRVFAMVRFSLFAASFAILALTATAGAEPRVPGSGGYVIKPLIRTIPASATPSEAAPYAQNYSEQVARRLGVRDGGLELLPPPEKGNPYAPSVSFNGSMLRLKWLP